MLINPSRYSKHFTYMHMLLSIRPRLLWHTFTYFHMRHLTISTSSVPHAARFDWHILYLLTLHVFSVHVSRGQIRRTLIPHHLKIHWLSLQVELTFLSSQVNLC